VVTETVECGAAAPADLTWLLHRCAQRLRTALDGVTRSHGLVGLRDWIVLSALHAEPGRTQLAVGHALGLDKTTLMSVLDRLEREGLVVRTLDPADRRARIPALTDAGREVQARVTQARDCTQAALLQGFSDDEQQVLRELLTRLADCSADPAVGSCI
jgi:MarR family transcriptional regulator, organic hydroperoxide resistance regulator